MELSQPLQAILFSGLTAGVLDITAASISNAAQNGRSPLWVFQSVAGGWIGAKTFQGGYPTAAFGLLTHFFIAMTWATIYYLASTKLPILTRQPIICGILYGLIVYAVMYGIVLPLSAYHSKPFNQQGVGMLIGILIHIFCIGLPIALITRWYAK